MHLAAKQEPFYAGPASGWEAKKERKNGRNKQAQKNKRRKRRVKDGRKTGGPTTFGSPASALGPAQCVIMVGPWTRSHSLNIVPTYLNVCRYSVHTT